MTDKIVTKMYSIVLTRHKSVMRDKISQYKKRMSKKQHKHFAAKNFEKHMKL